MSPRRLLSLYRIGGGQAGPGYPGPAAPTDEAHAPVIKPEREGGSSPPRRPVIALPIDEVKSFFTRLR